MSHETIIIFYIIHKQDTLKQASVRFTVDLQWLEH